MNLRSLGTGSGFRPGPPEFLASLGLLAGFMALVLVALICDGNRSNALRVGLAAGTYLVILSAAGGAAGLVSGVVRPEVSAPVVVVQALGAALLLGGFHWCAACRWRRVRGWITGGGAIRPRFRN